MTNFTQKINFKSALAFIAFLFISISTFGQTAKQDSLYKPDVYISRAPVSEISGHELLEKPWFWILIVVCIIVFISAYIGVQDKPDDREEPVL